MKVKPAPEELRAESGSGWTADKPLGGESSDKD